MNKWSRLIDFIECLRTLICGLVDDMITVSILFSLVLSLLVEPHYRELQSVTFHNIIISYSLEAVTQEGARICRSKGNNMIVQELIDSFPHTISSVVNRTSHSAIASSCFSYTVMDCQIWKKLCYWRINCIREYYSIPLVMLCTSLC